MLNDQECAAGSDPTARADLYREARWLARRVAFANPRLQFEKLLFVKRFTQETYPDVCLNHMPWVSRPGGDICVLTLAGPESAGEVRQILNGALGPGHVHGLDLWWDGERVVFGYAKAKSPEPPAGWLDRRTSFELRRSQEPTHLFEIGVDGQHLRQLTSGEWSDLDPTYLPSGDIVFVSERCGYSLQCNEYDKDETSTNLYVMRPDGSQLRRMSVTKDGDYLPHTLADGTVGYTRWEYQERGWANIQSLWFIRPDGTGADALFKQHFNDPWAVEDCRSIPGSTRLGRRGHGAPHLASRSGDLDQPPRRHEPSAGPADRHARRAAARGRHDWQRRAAGWGSGSQRLLHASLAPVGVHLSGFVRSLWARDRRHQGDRPGRLRAVRDRRVWNQGADLP